MSLLSQLFGGKSAAKIAGYEDALKALQSHDWAGFFESLPPDVQNGLLNFFITKLGKLP